MFKFSDGLVSVIVILIYPAEYSHEETGEAVGKKQSEAYPLGYIEDCLDTRTKLDVRFSILITCNRLYAAIPSLAPRPVPDPIAQPQSYGEVLR